MKLLSFGCSGIRSGIGILRYPIHFITLSVKPWISKTTSQTSKSGKPWDQLRQFRSLSRSYISRLIFLLVSEPLIHTGFILFSISPHFSTWTTDYNFIARFGIRHRAGKNSNYYVIPNNIKRAGPTYTDLPNSLLSCLGADWTKNSV